MTPERQQHLTEPQREALRKAGWRRSDTRTGEERWFKPGDDHTRLFGDLSCSGDLASLGEAARLILPQPFEETVSIPRDLALFMQRLLRACAGSAAHDGELGAAREGLQELERLNNILQPQKDTTGEGNTR